MITVTWLGSLAILLGGYALLLWICRDTDPVRPTPEPPRPLALLPDRALDGPGWVEPEPAATSTLFTETTRDREARYGGSARHRLQP